VRDAGALEAALALPRQTFAGQAFYPTLIDQAAALGFALIMNHPFIDGNKRVGHAAMEIFLLLNDKELVAPVDEQEQTMLRVASGVMGREALATWLATHVQDRHD
jgi:death-on-curing protein